VKFEDISNRLTKLLASKVPSIVIDELVLNSSYLIFENAGETIFRPGDSPMGFYWILEGGATEVLSPDLQMEAGPGQMVGLEEFLDRTVHRQLWESSCRTEAIFIDRRAYNHLISNLKGSDFITRQLSAQLLLLKSNLNFPHPKGA